MKERGKTFLETQAEINRYVWSDSKPQPRVFKIYSDIKLHADGSIDLDGLGIGDSYSTGDLIAHIPKAHVLEFLDCAVKLRAELKKRKLLPEKKKEHIAGMVK